MIRLLAISGSLREASSNTVLLRAAARIAPPNVRIEIETAIGALPHFNPDLEGSEPQVVLDFQKRVRDADGILFSTPEYAHGVPGVLKNALDWLVGSDAFIEKPFALLNVSDRGEYARASLIETLKTMSGILIDGASVTLRLAAKPASVEAITGDGAAAAEIREGVQRFAAGIVSARATRVYQP